MDTKKLLLEGYPIGFKDGYENGYKDLFQFFINNAEEVGEYVELHGEDTFVVSLKDILGIYNEFTKNLIRKEKHVGDTR